MIQDDVQLLFGQISVADTQLLARVIDECEWAGCGGLFLCVSASESVSNAGMSEKQANRLTECGATLKEVVFNGCGESVLLFHMG